MTSTATTNADTTARYPVSEAPDAVGEEVRSIVTAGRAVIRAELPGGIPAYILTRHEDARAALSDETRFSKDPQDWAELQEGRVPQDWPLLGFLLARNIGMSSGERHRRLRGIVQRTLTRRHVELLRPRIEEVTARLLDAMAAKHRTAGEVVDLKAEFALPLPLEVVLDLIGVPEDAGLRGDLSELSNNIISSALTPEEVAHTWTVRLPEVFDRLIDAKRAAPGDDLLTDLVQVCDGGELSREELHGELVIIITAAYETTVNTITGGVNALLRHPEQLALVRRGEASWEQAVAEVLRWDGAIRYDLPRYSLQDVAVGDSVIPKGSLVAVPLHAVGRCPHAYADADAFDVRRGGEALLLAFGHGAHRCPGAPLAMVEGEIALRALFDRFPDLALADPAEPLQRMPSLGLNSIAALPVVLGADAGH